MSTMSSTNPQRKVDCESTRKYHYGGLEGDAEDHNGVTSGRQAGIVLPRSRQNATTTLQHRGVSIILSKKVSGVLFPL